MISIRKGRRFVSKQGQLQPHVHSKARILSLQLYNEWPITTVGKGISRVQFQQGITVIIIIIILIITFTYIVPFPFPFLSNDALQQQLFF